ncbi:MAG: hypothetical protein PUQ00_19590 [Nostoc sp. S13]|nr:hypothetical protein [Nostoc sp. S13]
MSHSSVIKYPHHQLSVISYQSLSIRISSDKDGAFKLHKSSFCTAGSEPVELSLLQANQPGGEK